MATVAEHRKLFAREYACNFHKLPKTQPIDRHPLSVGDEEIVELPLAVPVGIATDLEAWATKEGLTTGQLMRRLIRTFLKKGLP
jgi:hypothetical protein